ncbi:MAG: hypothetical protein IKO36_10410 [Bacteroidaceae bacterium]|nr:hypothetical protein [Bacteroidaceae bacterium]
MSTKRITFFIISLYIVISAFAATKDLANDISMVSYEQIWLDSKGTLALKNNTNEEIHDVVFQIVYLDMSGNPIDYEDFTKAISIAPGMTRKLDIPAYEHSRYYHYFKSENMPGGSPAFKIKFQLKDYNVKNDPIEKANNINSDNNQNNVKEQININEISKINIIILFVAVLVMSGICVFMYILVAVMAQKRNRSVVIWVFLSLIATPLLMILILLVIGKNEDYVGQHYNKN